MIVEVIKKKKKKEKEKGRTHEATRNGELSWGSFGGAAASIVYCRMCVSTYAGFH